MDITKAKRDPAKVQSTLIEKNHQLITKTGCSIYVPENYTDKGLAIISSDVSILGVFALFINGNTYSVSKATSMMTLGQCLINSVMIGEKGYLKLDFEPGSVVIQNTNLVVQKKLINNVMDYFVDYGHTPWFMNYTDLAELFAYSGHFNNMGTGKDQAVVDIIAAAIARNPNNVREYYRHSLKSEADLTKTPRFIPLRDVAMNATSNLALINGSELQRSAKAALLSEPDRPEPLEDLMRL